MISLLDTLTQLKVVATITFLATLAGIVHRKLNHRRSTLPPGPPPESWIFGNKIQSAFAYRKFEEWTKTYGPIFYLRQGLTPIFVVGRYQAALDIMEREGTALADRPRSIAAGETLSGGMRVMFTPSGVRHKKMRKALHAYLSPTAVQSHQPILMRAAREHILDILENPHIHQMHARRYATSVVMGLAYAKSPKKHDDPDVADVTRCLVRLGKNLCPGLWQVDNYPILRYIPGYLDELWEGYREEHALFTKQLTAVRNQLTAHPTNPPPPSFASYLLERQASLGLTDDETAYLAGALFGAGSDTTASAISIAVLAAAQYPAAAKRVQDELDRIVGDRPPVCADWEGDRMPELHAFILESFRWRPVTAGGLPHQANRDIVYQGYVIPKGATVIGNVWSIGRDPAVFPDPEAFNPQRWLHEDGTLRDDLKSYPFGFGRRVCPGQYIAAASVLLNTALIQWAFNVRKDPKHPIDELAFTESANAHPEMFHVLFEPRIKGGVTSLREAMAEYSDI